MDNSDLLDSNRLETVGRIVSRYGEYLRKNDRVRLGIEGDPCYTYRSVDEAPVGTVEDVRHGDRGLVKFRVRLDGSDETVELDNRSFDPEHVWEIEPTSLDQFRERVFRGDSGSQTAAVEQCINDLSERLTDSTRSLGERISTLEGQTPYRGGDEIASELGGIKDDIRTLRNEISQKWEEEKGWREVIASTFRSITGDMMKVATGDSIEFSNVYAHKFDQAVDDRRSAVESDTSGADRHNRYQGAKFDFDYTPGSPVKVTADAVSEEDEHDTTHRRENTTTF